MVDARFGPRPNSQTLSGQPGESSTTTFVKAAIERGWKTMEEVARRYGISIRMMPYLIEDGIVPAYKIGLAVRINPVESDVAMRIFRKASKFDDIIDEELRGSAERAENIVKTATKRKKTVSGISAAS